MTEAFLFLRLMLTKGGGGGNGKGGEGDVEGRQGGVEDAGGGGGDGGGGDCGGREQGGAGAGGVIVKFGRSSIVVFRLPEFKPLILYLLSSIYHQLNVFHNLESNISFSIELLWNKCWRKNKPASPHQGGGRGGGGVGYGGQDR